MNVELYTADQSRGFMVEWLLKELDVPYKRHEIDLFAGEHKSPEYLAIHPQGAVPALLVDGEPIIESLGICLFLADAFSERKLAPAIGTLERARYCQWMVYATATIEPKLSAAFVRSLGQSPAQRKQTATPDEQQAMHEVLAPLLPALNNETFIARDFSAADVVIGSELHWAEQVGLLETSPEEIRAYLNSLRTRPAFPVL